MLRFIQLVFDLGNDRYIVPFFGVLVHTCLNGKLHTELVVLFSVHNINFKGLNRIVFGIEKPLPGNRAGVDLFIRLVTC